MSVGQIGKNISVRYKVEVTAGTPVTGGSGEEFRIHEGAGGISVARALIEDPESRDDGQRSMARHGAETVNISYPGTLSVGTWNTLIGALFRNTFTAAATLLTCDNGATYTSLAVTLGNTLTLVGSGSFLSLGVKVGDVVRLGASTAGSDSVNGIVATVAANVITFLGTPLTNFTADTNATLSSTKRITNSTTLTRSAYTFEEVNPELDESEQATNCRVVSMRLVWQPGGVARVEFGLMATKLAILGTAASPGLTSPTEYTSIGLSVQDATLAIGGTTIATVTGGEILFELGGETVPVVGSKYSPDVWEGVMKVSGQLTAIRTAMTASFLSRFLSETDNIELSALFVEPDAAVPIDFIHVFLPRIKYVGNTKNGLGNSGPIIETIPFYAAIKETTTGYNATTAMISTSV